MSQAYTQQQVNAPSSILRSWCLAGAVIITLLGFVWHYLYVWSGGNRVLGAIVPVNESVWEHLKLGFWPLVLFSIVEYPYIRTGVRNYFFAKLAGLLALEACILVVHYTYTSMAGRLYTGIDVSSFVLGVALGQYIACKTYRAPAHKKSRETIAFLSFIALGTLFMLTTYYPPLYGIFRDKNDNTIGIDKPY